MWNRQRKIAQLAAVLMPFVAATHGYAGDAEPYEYARQPICNTAEDAERLTRVVVEIGMPQTEALQLFTVKSHGRTIPTCEIPDVGPIIVLMPESAIKKTLSFRGVDYAYVRKAKIVAVPWQVNQETGERSYRPLGGGEHYKYVIDLNLNLTPVQKRLLCTACDVEA
ncbi:MAG: hypothetical protein HYT30_01500 [Parcubacteria group bacterium]|nr:hypothetical protein [Parcubacteria group bacterium]